jgi:hypothetical protein
VEHERLREKTHPFFPSQSDPLKEIRTLYSACDYLLYSDRLEDAADGDFPTFVLDKRAWYAARLRVMATDPHAQRHVQALNALKLVDRTKPV